jgi:hypothetical protein
MKQGRLRKSVSLPSSSKPCIVHWSRVAAVNTAKATIRARSARPPPMATTCHGVSVVPRVPLPDAEAG